MQFLTVLSAPTTSHSKIADLTPKLSSHSTVVFRLCGRTGIRCKGPLMLFHTVVGMTCLTHIRLATFTTIYLVYTTPVACNVGTLSFG